jgi:hypothetical protein
MWGTENNPYLLGSNNHATFEIIRATHEKTLIDRFDKYDFAPIVRMPSKRRISQPAFRLDFETLHDIRLRLQSGAIFIGAEMYFVSDIYAIEDDFLLLVKDKDGKTFKCWYKKTPEIDLRSPEPQYFTEESRPSYFMRSPRRQNRQAVCYDNCYAKPVNNREFHTIDPRLFMSGMSRDVLQWDSALSRFMAHNKIIASVRMSRDLAFYRADSKTIKAEYRGRELGTVEDDYIIMDELDAKKPWIRRDVNLIGCRVRT